MYKVKFNKYKKHYTVVVGYDGKNCKNIPLSTKDKDNHGVKNYRLNNNVLPSYITSKVIKTPTTAIIDFNDLNKSFIKNKKDLELIEKIIKKTRYSLLT